jgi:hypothetical protein
MGLDAAMRNQAIRRSQANAIRIDTIALSIDSILGELQDEFDDLFPQFEKYGRLDFCNLLMSFMTQINDIGNEAQKDYYAAHEYRQIAFEASNSIEARVCAELSNQHMEKIQEKYEKACALGEAGKRAVETIRKSLRTEPSSGCSGAKERVAYTPQRARSTSPNRSSSNSILKPLLGNE